MPKFFACWQFVAAGLFATNCIFQLAVAQEKALPGVSQPLSPAEALTKFQLAEIDLKIELVAAEPEVVDPVAIRFDERGRMWVAEMRDYPLGPPAGEPPLSRIKVLEDRDNDGKFETATLFAEKLSFVTGLQPWRGGVIVTLSGRIAWMKDSDNDGRMDVDETWYTGFAEQNSQLRANHPRLALDNHVYVANGLRGGVVVNKRLPDEKPISLQGRDFRFDPLSGKAESVSGNGQFGMCFDDWGNRFTCTNRNPVIHVVLEDRYLKLAPKIPIAAVVQDVAAAAEKSKVFPISRAWTTSNLHAGTFTAACGVHVYRGDTLRDVLGTNSVFTCDPTGNFVHLEKMKPDGPSFTSTPAYEGKEFLASTDEWFRPVNVELGPDGCLYIVDMYRCVIEHPDFVPDELKKRPDLRLGDDRGRIWRIVPKNGVPAERRKLVPLDGALPYTLMALLSDPNASLRETAQRLLLAKDTIELGGAGPLTVADALQKIAVGEKSPPLQRIHALWLLKATDSLTPEIIAANAGHADEQVRRHALLVAEGERPGAAAKAQATIAGVKEIGTTDRFQALLLELTCLDAQFSPPEEISILLPTSKDESRWLESAVMLRHHRHLPKLFYYHALVDRQQPTSLLQWLARHVGQHGTDSDAKIALMRLTNWNKDVESRRLRILVLASLAQGVKARQGNLLTLSALAAGELFLLGGGQILADLQDAATSPKSSTEIATAAIQALAAMPGEVSHDVLTKALVTADRELHPEVIAAIAEQGKFANQSWPELLSQYESHSLPIKRALIDNSFRRADGPKLLLEQVKAGVIQPAEIDPLRRKTLLESKDAAIKKLAEELFAPLNPANRQQALDEYQAVLKMTADAQQGAVVFEKNCSTCHRVGKIGVNVAPDISDTRTKTAAQLLADIIQPNRAIDSNFLGYQLLLKDGTAVSGLLSAETSTSLTLKQPGGKVLTIARADVEQLKATGVSLMPDGLEKNIPPQAMADLLSYLKHWRYLDGKTPLSP